MPYSSYDGSQKACAPLTSTPPRLSTTATKPPRSTWAYCSMSRPRSVPTAAMSTACPSPLDPGNSPGCRRAYESSELILPEYVRPPGNGTSTMSRAGERRETVSVTGSSDATIRVSVRNVERPTPASTPMMSTLVRAPAGDGEAAGVALGPALDSGPADAPGSAVGAAGFHAPLPVVD